MHYWHAHVRPTCSKPELVFSIPELQAGSAATCSGAHAHVREQARIKSRRWSPASKVTASQHCGRESKESRQQCAVAVPVARSSASGGGAPFDPRGMCQQGRGHTTGLAPDYLGKPKAGTMRVAQSREQADTTSKHAKSRGTRSGSEVRRRCKLGTGAMIPSVATAKGTAKKQGVARAASRIGMHSWWQAHTPRLSRGAVHRRICVPTEK